MKQLRSDSQQNRPCETEGQEETITLYLYRHGYFWKEVEVHPKRLTMTMVAWEQQGYLVKIAGQAW